MRLRACFRMVIVAAAAAGNAWASVGVAPPVFSDKTYAEARASVKGTEKLLLVKATAEWCGPCKAMNKTTFVDESVVRWVEGHGVAIELDVDKQPEAAKELDISAMPTMVLFRGEREIGRTVGYKNAKDLVAWMEDCKAGRNPDDELADRVKRADRGGARVSMQDRMANARNLVDRKQYAEATTEYIWLWNNIVKQEPAMTGVRGSFLASDIKRLTRLHRPAHAEFVKVRDAAEARLKGADKSWNDLDDWLVLNEMLGQTDKTLEWFDRVKNDPEAQRTIQRYSFRLERLLEESGRLGDLGKMMKNPVAQLKTKQAMGQWMPPRADEEMRKQLEEVHLRMVRSDAATMYAALLLAGREQTAEELAAEAMKGDDTAEMRVALVRKAVDNGAARSVHVDWLRNVDDVEGAADLRRDLEKQLGRQN
ncbi:MAG: thioredoxin family protein [Phycisphaerales bacterium]